MLLDEVNYKSNSKFYRVWSNMKNRCQNPNSIKYPSYGGRGITVCESWQKFENFRNDMFLDYRLGLSLDRIDNNKGYFKENCRWTDSTTQSTNRRCIRLFKYKGEIHPLSEWGRLLGINANTLRMRYRVYHTPLNRLFEKGVVRNCS